MLKCAGAFADDVPEKGAVIHETNLFIIVMANHIRKDGYEGVTLLIIAE